MPYSDDFLKILNRYKRQYADKAKAETFAFEEAMKKGIKPYSTRLPRYNHNSLFSGGQNNIL